MKEVNIISTVVQREFSGQRIPTGNTIIVEGGGSVDVESLKYEISKDFLKKKEDDRAEGRINFLKGIAINGEVIETVDTSEENHEPSDTSVPTSKRVEKRYLRKDKDDRSLGVIASDKGFEAGKFIPETGGAACYQDKDGNWHIETDHLRVRKKLTATEIEVQEVHHVGGQMLLTAANMIVDYVYEMTDRYRCYYLKKDSDGREVENLWQTGDQAYCNTFNLEKQEDGTLGNHYLWRLVVATNLDTADDAETRTFGDITIQTAEYNFVDLSKEVCAIDSDAPKANDEIVQLGYQPSDDSNRQNAILMAGAGSGSPYIYEFTGINSFTLPEPETRIKPGDNFFTGMMRIQGGSTGAENLEDFPEEVFKAVHIGAVNLLHNSGFTGDYKSEELSASSSLNSGSELYSKGLKYWTGSAAVSDDANAVSGKCAVVGSLSQAVELIKGESYVVSFRGKGASVKVMLGGASEESVLSESYEKYSFKFVSDGVCTFSISGDATICDLQLERGTIATDWKSSPYDNDKTLAEFQALKYLQDAIVEGDTTILGGLILSSIIKLGNFKDGKMQKVNAGVSGIYNDDDDVAFWGGGTFEQAIKTVMKFKENPNYQPTPDEWAKLANFVVTHGGDLFLRCTIFAENGYFRGRLEQGGGATILERDGRGHLANGGIRWEKNGLMYRKAADVIEWTRPESDFLDFEKGSYFDISAFILGGNDGTPPIYTIPKPKADGYRICISNIKYVGYGSAILIDRFVVRNPENMEEQSRSMLRIYGWAASSFWMTYNARGEYWYLDTDNFSVTDDTIILGLRSSIAIGESDSRTVVRDGKVVSSAFETNSGFFKADNEGNVAFHLNTKIFKISNSSRNVIITTANGKNLLELGFDNTFADENVWGTINLFRYGTDGDVEYKMSAAPNQVTVEDVKNDKKVTISTDKVSVDGKNGATKDVEIKDAEGTHTLSFVGGIFTGSIYKENEQ